MAAAESGQVVRTYARAALSATDSAAVEVLTNLESLMVGIASEPGLWDELLSPSLSSDQRSAVLTAALAGGHAATVGLVRTIVDHNRLQLLPEIVEEFRRLVKERDGVLDVDVVSAVELPEALKTKLEQRLSTATGAAVQLHPSVDPDIIGGLVIRHGDTYIDTSIRSSLERMRLYLGKPGSNPTNA